MAYTVYQLILIDWEVSSSFLLKVESSSAVIYNSFKGAKRKQPAGAAPVYIHYQSLAQFFPRFLSFLSFRVEKVLFREICCFPPTKILSYSF